MVIFIPVLENKYAVHNNNYCNNDNEIVGSNSLLWHLSASRKRKDSLP